MWGHKTDEIGGKKADWIDKVMSGEKEARIIYVDKLTKREIERAEYSLVCQAWEDYGKGTTLFNINVIIKVIFVCLD